MTEGDGSLSTLDRVRGSYGLKLGLALLAVVALVVSFGGVVFAETTAQLESDVSDQLASDAAARADSTGTWLDSVRRDARRTSAHPAVADGDGGEATGAYLRSVAADAPDGVVAVHYVDAADSEITASSRERFVGVDPAEQGAPFATDPPSFDGANDVAVTRPFAVEIAEFPVVAVVTPVEGREALTVYMVNAERFVASFPDAAAGGQTAVVDAEGTYVAHPDAETVGERTAYADAVGGDEVEVLREGDAVVAAAPVEGSEWTLLLEVSTAEAFAVADTVRSRLLALLLVTVISLAVIGVTVGSNTTTELRELEGKAEAMADGDLDVRMETDRVDEFGSLYASFGAMRDSLRESLAEAEQAREDAEAAREATAATNRQLARSADELSEAMADAADGDLTRRVDADREHEAMADVAAGINEMIAGLERTVAEVRSFALEVVAAAEGAEDDLSELNRAADDVADSVDAIADGADRQVDQLSEVAAEVETLSAGAEEVASTVESVAESSREAVGTGESGRESAEAAVEQMDAIEERAEATAEEMRALAEDVEAIEEMVDIIADVAEQTNLLALNASIEAARADEDGDGFAVVAEEVKSLAEETKSSAADIEERVERIRSRTDATVAEMEDTRERVTEGVATVEETVEALEAIVAGVEQTDDAVGEVRETTESQASSATEVAALVDEIEAISRSTADDAADVAAAAEQQTATLSEFGTTTDRLASGAEELRRRLEAFDVDVDATAGDDGAGFGGRAGAAGDDD